MVTLLEILTPYMNHYYMLQDFDRKIRRCFLFVVNLYLP
jgi:hypothetical protein